MPDAETLAALANIFDQILALQRAGRKVKRKGQRRFPAIRGLDAGKPFQRDLEQVSAQSRHQFSSLGHLNEMARRDRAQLRMMPARQRLEAGQAAVGAAHLGLILDMKLVVVQRLEQQGLVDDGGGLRRLFARHRPIRTGDLALIQEASHVADRKRLGQHARDMQAVLARRAHRRVEHALPDPAGDDDKRARTLLAEPPEDLDAVHPGHHQINGQHARLPLLDEFQEPLGITGEPGIKTLSPGDALQRAPDHFIVVDDQQPFLAIVSNRLICIHYASPPGLSPVSTLCTLRARSARRNGLESRLTPGSSRPWCTIAFSV